MIRPLCVVTLAALTASAFADRADGWAPSAGSATVAPAPPPAPPPRDKPAPEVAALGKALAGTYTCKGNTARGDGSSAPFTATLTTKLDLDNAWVVTTLVQKGGPLKWVMYRSFDARLRTWTRFQMVNNGGHITSTSPGEQAGKWTWSGTVAMDGTTEPLRDYEQKDGNGWKQWGEVNVAGGWKKIYEVTCKR